MSEVLEQRQHGSGFEPNAATPTHRWAEPAQTVVARRVADFLDRAARDVAQLPALTADQVRELRILWRAYQLANLLPAVSGETLLEIYTLHDLRQRVTAVALG